MRGSEAGRKIDLGLLRLYSHKSSVFHKVSATCICSNLSQARRSLRKALEIDVAGQARKAPHAAFLSQIQKLNGY